MLPPTHLFLFLLCLFFLSLTTSGNPPPREEKASGKENKHLWADLYGDPLPRRRSPGWGPDTCRRVYRIPRAGGASPCRRMEQRGKALMLASSRTWTIDGRPKRRD
jgi:hypothetical protein